jgi:4-hydroxy-tetrahydrodipicolinate reductase
VTSKAPRIALLGMGKMGRELATLAVERGVDVVASLDVAEVANPKAALAALRGAEVAIDFTTPDAAFGNIELCLEAGVPVVVGTTGWYGRLDEVRARVRAKGGALLYAPNFSLGVALLRALVVRAGELLSGLDGFEVHLVDTHHASKKDAPSGTALALQAALREGLGARAGGERDAPITSIRFGYVPGRHEVCIDGAYEQVRLVHEARSRRVFADGALTAALWLRGRTGVFTMDDVLRVDVPGREKP